MTESDALRILNLQAGCSAAQVRQAYLDLVKVWHPDRFQTDGRLSARAERELQEINEAYDLLQSVMAGTARPASVVQPPVTPRPSPASSPAPAPPSSDGDDGSAPASLVKTIGVGVGLGLVIAAAATMVVLMTRGRERAPATTTRAAAPSIPSHASPTRASADRAPAASPRPESGTEILAVHRSGGGSLVVINASRRDAVVALTAESGHERAVYVRANEQVTLANVATGTYRVQMMVGREWAADHFTREVGYQELEQLVQFAEKTDGNTTEYTKLTVALQPIVAGMRGIRAAQPFRITPQ